MWGKRIKQTVEIPYTMDLPEQYGGDEADCVLFITGEFVPGCPGSRLDPPEYDMFEYDTVKARTEECYGPVAEIDVWEKINDLPRDLDEELQGKCLEAIGLYDEPDYD